jgi:hypothetical protein
VYLFPGHVVWVTHFVVHEEHRRKGIAGRMCNLAWDHDEPFACGLVTSHPYAVRALEKGTNAVCTPSAIALHAKNIVKMSAIPYVQECPLVIEPSRSIIKTSFFVDHTELNQLIAKEKCWQLGELEDGDEFFAFTFSSLKQEADFHAVVVV